MDSPSLFQTNRECPAQRSLVHASAKLRARHARTHASALSACRSTGNSRHAYSVRYRVEKLRFPSKRDRSSIIVSAHLTIAGIPERAYDYEVNGRPAIEWVMDRHQVRTDKDSGIRNDPNRYSDDPRYIVDLLLRVVAVSVKTLDIVDRLRALEGSGGSASVVAAS
ncbi:type ISP restriction/modification enzyme [Capillimicrobium parvum]|uniref:Type ISP restriction-modification enzyme LLaBIII C-terminal specificity domain-containing protein n=1 Tax=Capillimicrobium parvum TaxID=2884022 RepID=A0A9E6XYB1_9ACTN|nr:type ISP restriction/modification enzyme [Capillimicrobium parvum]UGS36460.1 hypothetical protein DSM104329_02866 [Capillimicrobium parvum]